MPNHKETCAIYMFERGHWYSTQSPICNCTARIGEPSEVKDLHCPNHHFFTNGCPDCLEKLGDESKECDHWWDKLEIIVSGSSRGGIKEYYFYCRKCLQIKKKEI